LKSRGNRLEEAFSALENHPNISRLAEHKNRKTIAARINISPEEGKGYWDFIKISDELFVVVANYTYIDPRLEKMAGEGFIEFHIKLTGQLKLSAGRIDPIQVDGPSLLIWNQPQGIDASEWTNSNAEEMSVTIYCRPSYLIDNLLGAPADIPQELAKFIYNNEASINHCQLPITPDVLRAASDIATADERFEDKYWLIYSEAKTLELLCMILTAFEKLSGAADVSFSKYELDQLGKARAIAGTEFHPAPTIKQIARRVGINETKLRAGFKALFGITIFEFRHRSRMQHAKSLLHLSKEPLSIVAEKVGYRHQTTFTTAFKSYFGIAPKDYRKLRDVDPK
jgi:AraC-like DNA-binding protein